MEAAIIGASGYAGGELIRLVDGHPELRVAHLAANRHAGSRLAEVHPHLAGGDRVLAAADPDQVPDVDVAFLALPHGASAATAMALLDRGVHVVDLGSDLRLDTPQRYREAYGTDHPRPDQLGRWPLGIPELFAAAIVGSDRVAVPGCYPTSAVLAIAPLLSAGLVDPDRIVVDSISGVSGAGRSLQENLLFGAVDESVRAYQVTTHRHRPEMERILGEGVTVLFTPHLAPMQRGILTTVYATTVAGCDLEAVHAALDKAYADAPFVEVIDRPPETRWVVGSNRCLLSVHFDPRTRTVIVISAIDNLIKGAAGQAVQCANLVLGLDETSGLPLEGWMP